jgi:hypothetical protein
MGRAAPRPHGPAGTGLPGGGEVTVHRTAPARARSPPNRICSKPQDQANIAVAEAFTAAALGRPAAALRHARAALDHASALEISHEDLRWAWPLAARAAYDLADTATTGDLLALLDGYPAGQLAPMQRAERDLARARLAAAEDDPDAAAAAFTAAIKALRQHSTPYHLAHGLLDHAAHLATRGEAEAATAAIGEARGIAQRLGCQPLTDRADHPVGHAPHRSLVTVAASPELVVAECARGPGAVSHAARSPLNWACLRRRSWWALCGVASGWAGWPGRWRHGLVLAAACSGYLAGGRRVLARGWPGQGLVRWPGPRRRRGGSVPGRPGCAGSARRCGA